MQWKKTKSSLVPKAQHRIQMKSNHSVKLRTSRKNQEEKSRKLKGSESCKSEHRSSPTSYQEPPLIPFSCAVAFRREQAKTRLPLLLKHEQYKANPFAAIRQHAQNTMQ